MADTSGTDETGGSNGRSPISETTGGATSGSGAFGPNAWLVEDMYDRFRADPTGPGNDGYNDYDAGLIGGLGRGHRSGSGPAGSRGGSGIGAEVGGTSP